MTTQSPVSATVILSLAPRPDQPFEAWHKALLAAASESPGFQAAETFLPHPGLQEDWVVLLRFDEPRFLRAWLDAPRAAELVEQAAGLCEKPPVQLVVAEPGRLRGPVSMVIETHVPADRLEVFRAWQRDMEAEERRFPGFLDTRLLEPAAEVNEGWTVVIRFDTVEHLDAWVESDARRQLIARVEPDLHGKMRRVVSSFDGWFPLSVAGDAPPPPTWKQAMTVLVALYPTVMLVSMALDPWLNKLGWRMPARILTGNVVGTILLSWLIMPPLNVVLKPWLFPTRRSAALDLGVLALLVALCALALLLFNSLGN